MSEHMEMKMQDRMNAAQDAFDAMSAETEIAKLTAALALRQKASEWQPIATAPKAKYFCSPADSVPVAIWRGNWLQCWTKARLVDDEKEGKLGWYTGLEPLEFEPTHWMPLATPPPGAQEVEP